MLKYQTQQAKNSSGHRTGANKSKTLELSGIAIQLDQDCECLQI